MKLTLEQRLLLEEMVDHLGPRSRDALRAALGELDGLAGACLEMKAALLDLRPENGLHSLVCDQDPGDLDVRCSEEDGRMFWCCDLAHRRQSTDEVLSRALIKAGGG